MVFKYKGRWLLAIPEDVIWYIEVTFQSKKNELEFFIHLHSPELRKPWKLFDFQASGEVGVAVITKFLDLLEESIREQRQVFDVESAIKLSLEAHDLLRPVEEYPYSKLSS